MNFKVEIRGVAEPITVSSTQTILQAALDAGVDFPFGCRSGNCGVCQAQLLAGEVRLLPYSAFALSPEERSAGTILACRAEPLADCSLALHCDDNAPRHPLVSVDCRVEAIEEATYDIRRLFLLIEDGRRFAFSAGQFASLTFSGQPPRDYSMASRPDEPLLEFHIRHSDGGLTSRYVAHHLAVGDRLQLRGPFGTTYLRTRHRGPIIAVAGGSGLAPITSIVEQALWSGLRQRIGVYFGARDERDLYLLDRFQALAARHPNLQFTPVLSAPTAETSRRTGSVDRAIVEDFGDFDGCKAYLAGPPGMVETVTSTLTARGMRRGDIHADAFHSAAEMAARGLKTGDLM